jgi:hypothetical protein
VFKHERDLRRTTIDEYGPEISSTDALGVAPPAGRAGQRGAASDSR